MYSGVMTRSRSKSTQAPTEPKTQVRAAVAYRVLIRPTNKKRKTKDTHHFRQLLDCEMIRLTEACATWSSIKESLPQDFSEDITGAINSAIGQTQLLLSSKLEQFCRLVRQCGNADCVPPVLLADLEGFWDVVTLQIDKVTADFDKLQRLRASGWKQVLDEKVLPQVKAVRQKRVAGLPGKQGGPSGVKTAIKTIKTIKTARPEQPANANNETFNVGEASKAGSSKDPQPLPWSPDKPWRSEKRVTLSARNLSNILMNVSLSGKLADSPHSRTRDARVEAVMSGTSPVGGRRNARKRKEDVAVANKKAEPAPVEKENNKSTGQASPPVKAKRAKRN